MTICLLCVSIPNPAMLGLEGVIRSHYGAILQATSIPSMSMSAHGFRNAPVQSDEGVESSRTRRHAFNKDEINTPRSAGRA